MTRSHLVGFLALLLGFGLQANSQGAEPAPAQKSFTAAELAQYEKEVQPLLKQHCYKCHGEGKVKGGLRLLSRADIIKGGDLGPAVSLTKPETSILLKAIHYQDGLEMPPTGKLPAKDLATLSAWVKAGLPMPSGGESSVEKPEEKGGKVTPESRQYWTYQPLKKPAVPEVKNRAWVRNPVDAFILSKLEAKGIAPTSRVEKIALVRRLYYDLLGLAPTPEEVDSFVQDNSPDATSKLIDKLLDSPHYGEKWGRHWLDLVRYAESNGFERDSAKPFAWRYRDYVIQSLNADKPYDQFIREQLAGDELENVTSDTLTATGFYRLGAWDDEPADRLLAKYEVFDGIVSTTSQVFMGMTLGCARCHDHKKDPIPQRDYYRLLAFFRNVSDMDGRNTRQMPTEADRVASEKRLQEKLAQEAKWYVELYKTEQKFAAKYLQSKGGQIASESDLTDVSYKFYRDTWNKLPEFDSLKHEDQGTIAENYFSLAPASRNEAIGFVFEGKLKVPTAGKYAFRLESTDGSRLLLNGKSVLEHTGKGRAIREGQVELPAGLTPIRLEYFNTYTKPELKLAWGLPGKSLKSLTSEDAQIGSTLLPTSRAEPQVWNYTTTQPAENWAKPDFAMVDWKKGPGGFGTPGTPGAVVRTNWNSSNIWLRKTFNIDRLPNGLTIDLHHDEDVQVYLNGTLIYEAKGFTVNYARHSLPKEALAALKVGNNVLAVKCIQKSGGQYIDVGLMDGRPSLNDLLIQHGKELLGAEEFKQYQATAAQLASSRKSKLPEAGNEIMSVREAGQSPTHVLIRGNPTSLGEKVEPGFPEVLTNAEPAKIAPRPGLATGGRRLALAEWLTQPTNPVTARVMANRLWLYHFGRGIVPTPNDFGKLGENPTHPELLDWLASELVEGGWKLKRMHKLLLLSNTYQMSAQATQDGLKLDPSNMLFWRFPMRRLAAEEVRDSILQASGQLNLKAGGPSIYPPIPKEVLAGQSVPGAGWATSIPSEANRRSVYVHVKRSLQVPILAQHDQADTDSSCPVRYTTTVPTQALGMLNGEFSNQQATLFAERIMKESDSLADQVQRVIRLTTGRKPQESEVKKDMAYIQTLREKFKLDAKQALRQYCLLASNSNEFIYLD